MDIVTNVRDLDYIHATGAPNECGRSNSATLSGVVGKFPAALCGGGWCGARGGVVRPREGLWEGFLVNFETGN